MAFLEINSRYRRDYLKSLGWQSHPNDGILFEEEGRTQAGESES